MVKTRGVFRTQSTTLTTYLHYPVIFFKKFHRRSSSGLYTGLLKPFFFRFIRHCVKESKYGVFSGPHFPIFGLNTERYGVLIEILRRDIQSECGNIRTRKNSVFGHFSRSQGFPKNISSRSCVQKKQKFLCISSSMYIAITFIAKKNLHMGCTQNLHSFRIPFRKKDALTGINISICIEICTPIFVKAQVPSYSQVAQHPKKIKNSYSFLRLVNLP